MNVKKTTKKPDDGPSRLAAGELEILEMLWREQSATIREAQLALDSDVGYTTVQTRLERLVKKGLVQKSRTRPARYAAAVTPEQVGGNDLDLLVRRVSDGRVVPLVAHLLSRDSVTTEELAELKRLIAAAERAAQQRGDG
ncbi:MAG: BlaI/MecI/CopY family transcriptional regulator [Pirellulales bacterium]